MVPRSPLDCRSLFTEPPGPVIEGRLRDMLVGPVLVTYAITALGGVCLCLLVAALTASQRDRL